MSCSTAATVSASSTLPSILVKKTPRSWSQVFDTLWSVLVTSVTVREPAQVPSSASIINEHSPCIVSGEPLAATKFLPTLFPVRAVISAVPGKSWMPMVWSTAPLSIAMPTILSSSAPLISLSSSPHSITPVSVTSPMSLCARAVQSILALNVRLV